MHFMQLFTSIKLYNIAKINLYGQNLIILVLPSIAIPYLSYSFHVTCEVIGIPIDSIPYILAIYGIPVLGSDCMVCVATRTDVRTS